MVYGVGHRSSINLTSRSLLSRVLLMDMNTVPAVAWDWVSLHTHQKHVLFYHVKTAEKVGFFPFYTCYSLNIRKHLYFQILLPLGFIFTCLLKSILVHRFSVWFIKTWKAMAERIKQCFNNDVSFVKLCVIPVRSVWSSLLSCIDQGLGKLSTKFYLLEPSTLFWQQLKDACVLPL